MFRDSCPVTSDVIFPEAAEMLLWKHQLCTVRFCSFRDKNHPYFIENKMGYDGVTSRGSGVGQTWDLKSQCLSDPGAHVLSTPPYRNPGKNRCVQQPSGIRNDLGFCYTERICKNAREKEQLTCQLSYTSGMIPFITWPLVLFSIWYVSIT